MYRADTSRRYVPALRTMQAAGQPGATAGHGSCVQQSSESSVACAMPGRVAPSDIRGGAHRLRRARPGSARAGRHRRAPRARILVEVHVTRQRSLRGPAVAAAGASCAVARGTRRGRVTDETARSTGPWHAGPTRSDGAAAAGPPARRPTDGAGQPRLRGLRRSRRLSGQPACQAHAFVDYPRARPARAGPAGSPRGAWSLSTFLSRSRRVGAAVLVVATSSASLRCRDPAPNSRSRRSRRRSSTTTTARPRSAASPRRTGSGSARQDPDDVQKAVRRRRGPHASATNRGHLVQPASLRAALEQPARRRHPGRLDDHAAVREERLLLHARPHLHAQDQGVLHLA